MGGYAPLPKKETILKSWNTDNYKFKALCEIAWERANNNNDTIMFLNGPRGTGKSMMGVAALRHYLEKFLQLRFNKQALLDHTVYEHELLFERAKYLPAKHPILVDEGVRVAYTGDFGTKEVKDLIKFFAQCRTKNRFVMFVSPDFFDVAKRLRQYAHYRIRMIKRGLAVVFSRDNSEGVDPFHLDTLKEVEKYHDDTTPIEEIVNRLKKHPCFKDVVTIPEVPREIQDWYDVYRDMNVYSDNAPVLGSGVNDKAIMVLHNLITKWPELRILLEKERNKMFTQKLAYKELCTNPLNNEKFWSTHIVLSNHIRKLEKALELQSLKKDKIKQSIAGPLMDANPQV